MIASKFDLPLGGFDVVLAEDWDMIEDSDPRVCDYPVRVLQEEVETWSEPLSKLIDELAGEVNWFAYLYASVVLMVPDPMDKGEDELVGLWIGYDDDTRNMRVKQIFTNQEIPFVLLRDKAHHQLR